MAKTFLIFALVLMLLWRVAVHIRPKDDPGFVNIAKFFRPVLILAFIVPLILLSVSFYESYQVTNQARRDLDIFFRNMTGGYAGTACNMLLELNQFYCDDGFLQYMKNSELIKGDMVQENIEEYLNEKSDDADIEKYRVFRVDFITKNEHDTEFNELLETKCSSKGLKWSIVICVDLFKHKSKLIILDYKVECVSQNDFEEHKRLLEQIEIAKERERERRLAEEEKKYREILNHYKIISLNNKCKKHILKSGTYVSDTKMKSTCDCFVNKVVAAGIKDFDRYDKYNPNSFIKMLETYYSSCF